MQRGEQHAHLSLHFLPHSRVVAQVQDGHVQRAEQQILREVNDGENRPQVTGVKACGSHPDHLQTKVKINGQGNTKKVQLKGQVWGVPFSSLLVADYLRLRCWRRGAQPLSGASSSSCATRRGLRRYKRSAESPSK